MAAVKKLALVAIAGALFSVGCTRSEPIPTAAAAAPVKPAEAVAAPAAPHFYDTSGPLVVENQVDVAAQRDGVVTSLLADVGTHVRKDQMLAQLDDRQLRADRDAADAKVKSLQFEFQHWQAEVKTRETDLARDEEMFKAQLITEKQVEHSRYSVEGGKFEAQREAQELKNAQDTLRSLDLELEKTRIVAPFDGVVGRRYIRVGQRIAANERTFWVTALAPVTVRFTVPQELAGKIHAGDTVELWPQGSAEKQRHPAQVSIVSPVVDPSSGTIEVQARVNQMGADLLPGMTVNVRVPAVR